MRYDPTDPQGLEWADGAVVGLRNLGAEDGQPIIPFDGRRESLMMPYGPTSWSVECGPPAVPWKPPKA